MFKLLGYMFILAGLPLTLFFCFPGLASIGVGCLLVLVGRKP